MLSCSGGIVTHSRFYTKKAETFKDTHMICVVQTVEASYQLQLNFRTVVFILHHLQGNHIRKQLQQLLNTLKSLKYTFVHVF